MSTDSRYTNAMSEQPTDDHDYIDLDDPPHWWAPVLSALTILLLVAVIIAPWFVSIGDEEPVPTPMPGTNTLCRPNFADLPSLFNPTVYTWSRLCEWFIAPEDANGE